MFYDPMAGKGQPPPLPSAGLTNYVARGQRLSGLHGAAFAPGAILCRRFARRCLPARILSASNDVTFSDNGTGFGNYVFYGGLAFPKTHTTATFYPGRYVLAGTQSGNDILSYHTQVTLQDNSVAGTQNTDAGEIFIFTDPTYPGLCGNIIRRRSPAIPAS